VQFLHTVRNVYFGGFLNVRPMAASEPLLPPALHSKPQRPVEKTRSPEEEAQQQSARNFGVRPTRCLFRSLTYVVNRF
jgi:hypothetical protein